MKKVLLIGLLGLTFVAACKKKKDDPAPKPVVKDQITQFWFIDHVTLTGYDLSSGNVVSSSTVDGKSKGYFLSIKSNYTYSLSASSNTSGTWSLPDDNTLIMDGNDKYTIESISSSNMVLSQNKYPTGTSTRQEGKLYLYK